jgi:hypothetical protein
MLKDTLFAVRLSLHAVKVTKESFMVRLSLGLGQVEPEARCQPPEAVAKP